ncbi:MAG: hypothetical protein ACRD2E_11265 [Terriglobales bacterium]
MPPHIRPDPDRLLRQAEAEEETARRGRLKVFLGYTSGVGKSFRMLDEGRRRAQRGQDVVVGAIQPRNSPEVEVLLARLEMVPPRAAGLRSAVDVPAILRRRPEVCLVDGLAYANPPGSERPNRWQDVEALLAAGISTIATVNLQFIAERGPAVERITGRPRDPHDTIPEAFLRAADEIEVVDAPPEAAVAPGPEEALLRRQRLSELRELALLLAADVVDQQLEAYLRCHGLQSTSGAQERILVCIGGGDASAMIASGRRNADRFHGELIVAHVQGSGSRPGRLARNMDIARAAGAEIHLLAGDQWVETILRFSRARGVTQIFIGHTARETWLQRLRGGRIERLIRRGEGMDIRIFPHRDADSESRPATPSAPAHA